MTDFNYEKLKEYKPYFEKEYAGYLPLVLHNIIDSQDYFKRITPKIMMEFLKKRDNIPEDFREIEDYLEKDLINWLKKNPQFKDIIKNG